MRDLPYLDEVLAEIPADIEAKAAEMGPGTVFAWYEENASNDIRVTDPRTHTPLVGVPVEVALETTKLATFTTDADGTGKPTFRVPDWADGSYVLRVTATAPAGADVTAHTVKVRRCKTRLVSGTVKFTTTAAAVGATVSRAGVVYASGIAVPLGAGRWQLILADRLALAPGRYVLALHSRVHGRWILEHKAITIT